MPAHVEYPASALHGLPNAVFYVTTGAAKLLTERQVITLQNQETIDDATVEHVLIDLSCRLRKRLVDITDADVESCRRASIVLKRRGQPLATLTDLVKNS